MKLAFSSYVKTLHFKGDPAFLVKKVHVALALRKHAIEETVKGRLPLFREVAGLANFDFALSIRT
jgi:hypothetical protein